MSAKLVSGNPVVAIKVGLRPHLFYDTAHTQALLANISGNVAVE
jgi:hypothetical protein